MFDIALVKRDPEILANAVETSFDTTPSALLCAGCGRVQSGWYGMHPPGPYEFVLSSCLALCHSKEGWFWWGIVT